MGQAEVRDTRSEGLDNELFYDKARIEGLYGLLLAFQRLLAECPRGSYTVNEWETEVPNDHRPFVAKRKWMTHFLFQLGADSAGGGIAGCPCLPN